MNSSSIRLLRVRLIVRRVLWPFERCTDSSLIDCRITQRSILAGNAVFDRELEELIGRQASAFLVDETQEYFVVFVGVAAQADDGLEQQHERLIVDRVVYELEDPFLFARQTVGVAFGFERGDARPLNAVALVRGARGDQRLEGEVHRVCDGARCR